MRWSGILTLAIVCFVVGYVFGDHRPQKVASPETEILKAKLAEAILSAEAVPETVTTTIVKTRTFRDTLDVHDTVQVKEFVIRVDTLLQRCRVCATALEATLEAARPVALAPPLTCPVPGFRERLGVFGGYGLNGYRGDIRTGWQLGAGVRLWP